jgi:DedD protein
MFAPRSSAPGKAPASPPQSIDAVRRRARHRLIGAAVLVLLGVIGFPLLFDTEPRPISVDIPIEIPAKNPKPSLLAAPVEKPVSVPETPAQASVAANESLSAREEVVESAPPMPIQRPAEKPSNQPVEKPTGNPESAAPETPAKPPPAGAEAERALALLQGKPAPEKPPANPPAAGTARLVVQVGAFGEAAGAREVRSKLERAGLKTYTHVAQTPQGQRIRVRVGPFDSRAEAEKAAARIKALGLPAAILTL